MGTIQKYNDTTYIVDDRDVNIIYGAADSGCEGWILGGRLSEYDNTTTGTIEGQSYDCFVKYTFNGKSARILNLEYHA